MTKKDTGGLAFPIIGPKHDVVEAGMSLRDYFAAKAMGAVVSGLLSHGVTLTNKDGALVAERAYELADAMIKAR